MTSSLRVSSLDDTLAKAKVVAKEIGIARVTDTTWLDSIGIPVFASIRPDSLTLRVNAGKGVHRDEARVGAYMEAIEFALAEPRNNAVEVVMATPREVQEQANANFAFVDLCPILGKSVDADGPLACVQAHDIMTGEPVLVPAELAFSPFPDNPGQQLFGSGTNGLCSGNSVAEATVHGIFELIERDVRSFNYVRDDSRFVEFDECGRDVRLLLDRFRDAGMDLVVRYTAGEFGFPYFDAFVFEDSDDAPISIAHGAGLHAVTEIAVVRALCEAAQSRLTTIHGGRDDLINRHDYFARFAPEVEQHAVASARAKAQDCTRTIRYLDIPKDVDTPADLDGMLSTIMASLRKRGVFQALRVVLSAEGAPLAAVKVIIPKLEMYRPIQKRVGPRLAAAIEAGDR
jgi:ribosomal protein S12 methylthiotransferase accessory factor